MLQQLQLAPREMSYGIFPDQRKRKKILAVTKASHYKNRQPTNKKKQKSSDEWISGHRIFRIHKIFGNWNFRASEITLTSLIYECNVNIYWNHTIPPILKFSPFEHWKDLGIVLRTGVGRLNEIKMERCLPSFTLVQWVCLTDQASTDVLPIEYQM